MTYVPAKEVAVILRKKLKALWPGIKFSVRSDHSAINIGWTGGPSQGAVDAIVGVYSGGGFDGSIDLAYSKEHWLLPNGDVTLAENHGSAGSGGYVNAESHEAPCEGAKKVRLGSTYVFTSRQNTKEEIEAALENLQSYNGVEEVMGGVFLKQSDYDGSWYLGKDPYVPHWSKYLSELVRRNIRETLEGREAGVAQAA